MLLYKYSLSMKTANLYICQLRQVVYSTVADFQQFWQLEKLDNIMFRKADFTTFMTSILDIPCMAKETFNKCQKALSSVIHEVAWQRMDAAAKEEASLAL
ncbi:hypothetical protein PR048_004432 [Dryococelus australis]|uniref:Uncharacterized protein n=1 Tax=Dryococelus australis TaxID=614101 RepID=A0ABQ9I5W2_9NEOP|nr:hypothetical protein PR048_004432 [Dryococelus australis]